MSKPKLTNTDGWVYYLLVPLAAHAVLRLLARIEQFRDGPLENTYVRLGIAFAVTVVVAEIVSRRRSAAVVDTPVIASEDQCPSRHHGSGPSWTGDQHGARKGACGE
jgi:hypothetical protein